MASVQASKRLTREYKLIQANPPPYIVAHPSESNILEWHYILSGPPDTPYTNGQYWGTLVFPANYPFAPPAIRMHTPSGRFQPSTRLCLSISDFHPKSFNPAWEVSTILIGLLSFMTSEEMTTGSVSATPQERRMFASQSRWWNSTGGGSTRREVPGVSGSNAAGHGNVKAGDGGAKFRSEWPELDADNWSWMAKERVDPRTCRVIPDPAKPAQSCVLGSEALRQGNTGNSRGGPFAGVVEGGQQARNAGQGWIRDHKLLIALGVLLGYVMIARIMGSGSPGDL